MTTAEALATVGPGAGTAVPRPGRRGWQRALGRGQGRVGLVQLALVVLAGLLAPLLSAYPPELQLDRANLLTPTAAHPLGTDQVNRDVLARTLHGIRVDLLIVFTAVPLGALLGTAAALLSTTATAVDVGLQRLFDLLLAFPTLIFAIGLTAVAGPGTLTVIAVIATVETPVFARVLRSAVLKVQELPYVEAARTMGAGRWWLLRRHVLPNAAEPLGVQLAISLSLAVFVESAMSFLGIGVRPPAPSLGGLISDGIGYAETNAAYVLGPLAVVVVLVLALQLLARALAGTRRVAR